MQKPVKNLNIRLAKLIIGIIFFTFNITSYKAQNNFIDSSDNTYDNVITIASEPDYPPYCIVNNEGFADGFSVDLFKASAKAVGLEVKIKIGIWNKIKNDLAEGRIDALPLVGKTPERELLYDFTLPYLSLHGAIFVRDGNDDIKSLEDLKRKKIVVMKGDNAEEFLKRENISDNITTTNTFEEAFQFLSNGHFDAIITQRITGLKLLEELDIENVKALDMMLPQYKQDFCFAVRKGDENLLKLLNEGLSIVIANNTYENLRFKWFGPAIKTKFELWDIISIVFYVSLPIIILTTIISIVYLRKEVATRTISLTEEIIEHKKTLEELKIQKELSKENEEQIRLLLNSTAEGIYGIDANGNCTFINKSAIKILGYKSEEQLINKNMHNLIHYNKRDGSKLHINECKINKSFIEGEGTRVNDEVFWCADGSCFDVEYTSFPIKQDSNIVGVVITFWDITESKKMTDDLRETKEYLENLINYASSPIIVWNNNFEIERFNRAFEELTCRTFNEVKGKNIEILFPEYEKLKIMELIDKTTQGIRLESAEIDIISKDGNIKTVLWNSANLYDKENKKIMTTIAQGHDITERKNNIDQIIKFKNELEDTVQKRTAELQDKINKLNKSQQAMLYMVEDLNEVTNELKDERRKLELSNKELEAFSYSVSHDLRSPLRAIDGFSKFLEEDFSDKINDEGKRLIKVIRENTIRMDQLISDMLNLSRVSTIEMSFSEINMGEMAKAMYYETASEEEKNSFIFTFEKTPLITGDPPLLKQVWINLIGNALKYSRNSELKKIEIGCENKDNNIIFWVKDYGAGFNQKYLSKLFGVFQRLHSNSEFEGTGVGLAIAKRIIHRHNGEIWAQGEINKGATFYFSLPKI